MGVIFLFKAPTWTENIFNMHNELSYPTLVALNPWSWAQTMIRTTSIKPILMSTLIISCHPLPLLPGLSATDESIRVTFKSTKTNEQNEETAEAVWNNVKKSLAKLENMSLNIPTPLLPSRQNFRKTISSISCCKKKTEKGLDYNYESEK